MAKKKDWSSKHVPYKIEFKHFVPSANLDKMVNNKKIDTVQAACGVVFIPTLWGTDTQDLPDCKDCVFERRGVVAA